MRGRLKLLNKILHKAGFELRKYNPRNSDDYQLYRILEKNEIKLVLDVGANTGQYASTLREIGYKEKIISFEPLSLAHKMLLEKSKGDTNWKVAPRMAIGDKNGEIEINISENLVSSSIFDILDATTKAAPNSKYMGIEEVNINELDRLVGTIIPQDLTDAFLKLDVQGYEVPVFEGAKNVLNQVQGVQVELSLTELYEDQELYDSIIIRLQNLGFRLYAIFQGFTDNNAGRLLQMDGIFIRETTNS